MPTCIVVFLVVILCAVWYIRQNDRKLRSTSHWHIQPRRWTTSEIKATYARVQRNPIDITPILPPRTGRKYIVTGGAGFLGGWIVLHLLKRGEDPRRIRVLDIRKPTREDLNMGAAKHVDFIICDIRDEKAVHDAFSAPWPESDGPDEVTVFHTVAAIRFYERAWSLVPLSASVNVKGTQHVINASRFIGASVLISASSGSVVVRRSRFWLWPWEDAPPHFVQYIDDDDKLVPERHDMFFSNYAYTKRLGEALVHGAHGSPSAGGRVLRTGCLRPGNGMYGSGGDINVGAYLVRGYNPTWISNIVQNHIYVENASYAFQCYEQRLLATWNTSTAVGGRAYCIVDDGPPPTYGDIYNALTTLANGRVTFAFFSPTMMLFVSHIIELVYLSRHFLLNFISTLPGPLHFLTNMLPPLPDELANLQPSLFALADVNLVFSDSRARDELGYNPPWTTLDGVCTLVDAHMKSDASEEARQRSGGGIGLGFNWRRKSVAPAIPRESLTKSGELEHKSEKTKHRDA